ncbi:hypothetical protein ACFLWR_01470 [Chloroflexota bacterium]
MNRNLYFIETRDFLDEWIEKWYALIELINNVTSPGEPAPTLSDESEYQCLRIWLIEHQRQFLPLYRGACESHDWEYFHNRTDRAWESFRSFGLCFYKPENLYRLAQQLELQNGIDIWEPNEDVTKTWRPFFLTMTKLMIEFRDGIDERLDTNR